MNTMFMIICSADFVVARHCRFKVRGSFFAGILLGLLAPKPSGAAYVNLGQKHVVRSIDEPFLV